MVRDCGRKVATVEQAKEILGLDVANHPTSGAV